MKGIKPSPEEIKRRNLMMEIVREEGITSVAELYSTLKDMFAGTMEDMLQVELDTHLGYEKHDQHPKDTPNRRNGVTTKIVRSHEGEVELSIPRDRDGSFEPQLVKKGQKDVSSIQEKVMSMYAKGISDRDISAIIQDIYGFELSHETISRIVEAVYPRFETWQSRPLDSVYTFVYVDAMIVKVKDNGRAINKAAYTIIGVNTTGHKEVLGIWLSQNEGAHFWMGIFDEIKSRGVEQLLIICIDGLKELEVGIRSVFPKSHIQRCIVHLQRNSLRYIPTKHYKEFCSDAKAIYAAVSLQSAEQALHVFKEKWAEYPWAVRVWVDNFEQIERLFELPSAIRKMAYTTNMIEGLNSALRKVTRGKGAFPNDEAVFKALYLRIADMMNKWITPISNWSIILGQLNILFPETAGL